MKIPKLLRAVTFTAAGCSSPMMGEGDAGHDAGAARDAGRSDAGTDAGYGADAGCPCFTDAGVCKVPADFPAATEPPYIEEAICECVPNNASVFCFFETAARCSDWSCRPAKKDAGLSLLADGGVECLCFA